MIRILHALLVLGFGLPGLSVHASDNWYHVELMVFAHERASDEQWRRNRLPAYPASHIHFSEHGTRLPDDADDALRDALSQGAWQPVSNLSMDDMRERMAESGHYRTLFHDSWRQPISAREQAVPVYIQGARMLDVAARSSTWTEAGFAELAELAEPADSFEPDLSASGLSESGLSEFDLVELAGASIEALASPAPLPELQGTLTLSESRFLHVEPNLWLALHDGDGEYYFASLTQSRRLRVGELHYIDNPRLGVLIKVSQ